MTLPPIPSRLHVLRTLLLEAKEFHSVAEYFQEYLAADQAFLGAGLSAPNPLLIQALEHVLRGRFGGPSGVHASQLIHVSEHHFWHGSAIWGAGGLAMIVYFTRLDVGLFTVFRSLGDSTAHFTRFSLHMDRSVGSVIHGQA